MIDPIIDQSSNPAAFLAGVAATLTLTLVIARELLTWVKTRKESKAAATDTVPYPVLRSNDEIREEASRAARLAEVEKQLVASWHRVDELREEQRVAKDVLSEQITRLRVELARLPDQELLKSFEQRITAQISQLDAHVATLARIASQGIDEHVKTFHR